jgi:thymidine phosphorylase
LDVLAVLQRAPDAPRELREKSLYLAARLLERVGAVPLAGGYRAAQGALDSGAALERFEAICTAQGRRPFPEPARFLGRVEAPADGCIRAFDCLALNQIAKLAGAPAQPAAGLRVLHGVGEVVVRGDALLEVHAESESQLEFALAHARTAPGWVETGY